MANWILTITIFSPLLGILWILASRGDSSVRTAAFVSSVITLALTTFAAVLSYDASHLDSSTGYSLVQNIPWMISPDGDSSRFSIGYFVGVDGISIWLLVLAAFLMPLAIAASFTAIKTRVREYYIFLLLLHVALLGVFCAMDLLLFYVFFEFTLVPLYFLIAIWGGHERRRAANKFFIYTIAGSMLTFAGIVYLGYFAFTKTGSLTMSIPDLVRFGRSGIIPSSVQWWVFAAFAAGFAIKVPLFPLHTWLPLAHTEAPTAGSAILAGVLLKLGTYGFCRLSLAVLPDASLQWAPVIAIFSIIGIIYASLAAWVQKDVKKLVAYSSVAHLGFCMLGMFSLKVAGVSGAVIYMINHGLSTGALFLLIGAMYERYHTRDMDSIGGLAKPMPWFAFFLVFFTLSSIGLPGLNGFIGEFLVLVGTATSNTTKDSFAAGPLGYNYAIPAAVGIILGAVYMLWLCQRVLFGPLKQPPHTPDHSSGLSNDLTSREILILTPMALACILIGVYPRPLLNSFENAIAKNVLRTPLAVRHADVDHNELMWESALAISLHPSSVEQLPSVSHSREHLRAAGFSPRLASTTAWPPDQLQSPNHGNGNPGQSTVEIPSRATGEYIQTKTDFPSRGSGDRGQPTAEAVGHRITDSPSPGRGDRNESTNIIFESTPIARSGN